MNVYTDGLKVKFRFLLCVCLMLMNRIISANGYPCFYLNDWPVGYCGNDKCSFVVLIK